MTTSDFGGVNRRQFVKFSAAAAAAALTPGIIARGAYAGGRDSVKVGIIGCGGRGTGAGVNSLQANEATRITALADVFPERVESCRKNIQGQEAAKGGRADIPDDLCFTGFDAYKKLLATELDVVILATPPHFRPMHLAAAVEAGKHVFIEKPVAVDPTGIRSVLASAELADKKGLCVVAGTQRRHERSYLAAMERIRGGSIGRIVSARCSWNQGGLWMNERKPEWSDMEWQLRNWLYFTWLSGDHIVEQHVHNLDVVNWAMGAHPIKATGLGGRQVRTSPAYGHIFDHFAIEFEYPGGVMVSSQCRQIDGCSSRVDETIKGTEGICNLRPGYGKIEGAFPWSFKGENPNPYVQEHADLLAAIRAGEHINELTNVAHSTLTAIMGRMSAYTGQDVTWDQAMNSTLDLSPPSYEMGPLPTPAVPMPGRVPLV